MLSIACIEFSGSITGDRTTVLFKKLISAEADILNAILPPKENPIKWISLSGYLLPIDLTASIRV